MVQNIWSKRSLLNLKQKIPFKWQSPFSTKTPFKWKTSFMTKHPFYLQILILNETVLSLQKIPPSNERPLSLQKTHFKWKTHFTPKDPFRRKDLFHCRRSFSLLKNRFKWKTPFTPKDTFPKTPFKCKIPISKEKIHSMQKQPFQMKSWPLSLQKTHFITKDPLLEDFQLRLE